jgi:AcrR family transcriptional regulator
MARVTDESKIDRIKDAAIQMVVNKGFGGATISEIAKQAGVADGYLYRYYSGKNELVNDLLFIGLNLIADKIESLIEAQHTPEEIIENCIRTIFDIAAEKPEWIKFIFVLMHDYNFNISVNQRERIIKLCSTIKLKGRKSGYFAENIGEEEIYLMAVVYPIQLINLRFKNFFKKTRISKTEIENTIRICLKSLK